MCKTHHESRSYCLSFVTSFWLINPKLWKKTAFFRGRVASMPRMLADDLTLEQPKNPVGSDAGVWEKTTQGKSEESLEHSDKNSWLSETCLEFCLSDCWRYKLQIMDLLKYNRSYLAPVVTGRATSYAVRWMGWFDPAQKLTSPKHQRFHSPLTTITLW